MSCWRGLVVVDVLLGTGYCPVRTVRFRDSVHFDTDSVRNRGWHQWKKAYNIWCNLMKIWYRFRKELPRKIIRYLISISVNLILFSKIWYDSIEFDMVLNYRLQRYGTQDHLEFFSFIFMFFLLSLKQRIPDWYSIKNKKIRSFVLLHELAILKGSHNLDDYFIISVKLSLWFTHSHYFFSYVRICSSSSSSSCNTALAWMDINYSQ